MIDIVVKKKGPQKGRISISNASAEGEVEDIRESIYHTSCYKIKNSLTKQKACILVQL